MRDRTYTTEEVVRGGREIYEREVRAKVEASHDGEFVVVDIITGAWEVDEDDVAASERVLAKNPDAVLYFARVGRQAAYRLGYRLGYRHDHRLGSRYSFVAGALTMRCTVAADGSEALLSVECVSGGEVRLESLEEPSG